MSSVRCILYVEPRETLTGEETTVTKDIVASEIGKIVGGEFSVDVTDYSGSAANQGYKDRIPNYLEVVDDVDTTDISAITDAKFLFIKNTGYQFNSATALGSPLDKSLKVMSGANQIALLPAGAGWCTPNSNGIDCTAVHVRTVDNDGTNNASAGHLAALRIVLR